MATFGDEMEVYEQESRFRQFLFSFNQAFAISNRLREKDRNELSVVLRKARMDYDPDEYVTLTYVVWIGSFFGMILVGGIFVIALGDIVGFTNMIVGDVIAAFFVSTIVYSYSKSYPYGEIKDIGLRIEAELPFMVRNLAIEREMGIPIKDSFEKLSEEEGLLGRESRVILAEIERGYSVTQALRASCQRTESRLYVRTMAQLTHALEIGTEIKSVLNAMAKEAETNLRIALKEYSGKVSTLSIMYVIVAAVVPAILGAALILSVLFEEGSTQLLSADMLMLLYWGIFPLINYTILAVMKRGQPYIMV